MKGIPFNNLEGSNKFEEVVISSSTAAAGAEISASLNHYWKKQEEIKKSCFFGETEPTSVLDSRRTPSSPTSTLSASSFGGGGGGGVLVAGGGGSTDTASVAAVSDNNPLQKWPTTTTTTTQEENSTATPDVSDAPASSGSSGGGGGGGNRKDEWGSELQAISSNHHEIVNSGGGGGTNTVCGGEKYGGGLAMEDWDSMLSETEASPSLLRWIIDGVEDPTSSAALLQAGAGAGGVSHLHNASSDHNHHHFVGNNAGFGIVDPTAAPSFGFESIGGGGGGGSMNLLGGGGGVPGSGFSSGRMNFNNSTQQQQQQNPSKISSSPGFNTGNPFTVAPNHNLLPPPGVFYHNNQQFEDEKPQLYHPQLLMMNQNQQPENSSTQFFAPLTSYQQDQTSYFPPPERQQGVRGNPSNCHFIQKNAGFMDSGQEHFLRKQQHHGFPHQLHLLHNHLQNRPPSLVLTKPKLDEHQNQQHNQQQQPQQQQPQPQQQQQQPQQQQQQQQQLQQVLVDQLFKAAELVESGNSVLAQGILARLNHQLSHPIGKPLYRAAFYFKEALLQLLNGAPNSPPPHKNLSNFDVVLKIGAYKAFSEISPLLQFSNFTVNQALLESLDGFDHIHIIDFDIGIGGQWASFMQEIAMKMGGAPSLKISAFASFSSNDHHKLELALTREHLTHFANDLGISFEIDVVDLDTLDPSSWSLPIHVSEKETVAVNLPVGDSSCINPSSIPALLRLVIQLSPKIVVSVDRGCDRSDLPFSLHFLQALQAYSILLDSLDATNSNSDAISKIERFLVQPRIESTVFQHHHSQEKLPPWRTLFASAGFSPITFSNFTETQAECLLKRLQGRGFHVEKRQASLVLCWQRRELVSASAWRC